MTYNLLDPPFVQSVRPDGREGSQQDVHPDVVPVAFEKMGVLYELLHHRVPGKVDTYSSWETEKTNVISAW